MLGKKTEEVKTKWLIKENNKYKRAWDIWVLVCVAYVAFVMPYRDLAFMLEETKRDMVTDYIADGTFLIDMILSFFSVYFDAEKVEPVTDRKRIALHYMKGWFAIDLISIIPFQLLGSAGKLGKSVRVLRFLKIWKLVRLIRIARLQKSFEKQNQETEKAAEKQVN